MTYKKTKILVVDDEPDVAETLKHFFSFRGYDVVCALSGKEALEILEKEKQDLILLDVVMPDLNGGAVANIIKERYPKTKVVVVTGYPKEADKISSDNLLDGIFLKPIRIQELYTKVEDVLKKEESPLGLNLALKAKKNMEAEILFIKANLLFVEPNPDNYCFLSAYFKKLCKNGEKYYLEVAGDKNEITEKLSHFKSDIILVNTTLFKDMGFILGALENKKLPLNEIIAYNMESSLPKAELEKLTKTIERVCLKSGFLEIGKVEI